MVVCGLDSCSRSWLRHLDDNLAITILNTSGVDAKTVAERHGDTLKSETLDRCAHFLPASDRQAADLLERLLGLRAE